MRKILLASHGRVASGLQSAIKILTGDTSNVVAVDFYIDESDKTPEVEAFIAQTEPGDEAIIFTDLKGGSVCNSVVALEPEKRGVLHVTGMNLIAILGCLLSDEPLTASVVESILATSREQLELVSLADAPQEESSEEDFFA